MIRGNARHAGRRDSAALETASDAALPSHPCRVRLRADAAGSEDRLRHGDQARARAGEAAALGARRPAPPAAAADDPRVK